MSAANTVIEALLTLLFWAVQSVSRGLYSQHLPLVPARARVTQVTGTGAGYTVYFDMRYLYFGYVEMSWISDGTYNMEKPLN